MIVVAILGIVLAIAATTWLRQRVLARQRSCQEQLAKIDGAKEQWALTTNAPGSTTPAWSDLVSDDGSGYLKHIPVCPGEGVYDLHSINEPVTCTITEPLDHNSKDF